MTSDCGSLSMMASTIELNMNVLPNVRHQQPRISSKAITFWTLPAPGIPEIQRIRLLVSLLLNHSDTCVVLNTQRVDSRYKRCSCRSSSCRFWQETCESQSSTDDCRCWSSLHFWDSNSSETRTLEAWASRKCQTLAVWIRSSLDPWRFLTTSPYKSLNDRKAVLNAIVHAIWLLVYDWDKRPDTYFAA